MAKHKGEHTLVDCSAFPSLLCQALWDAGRPGNSLVMLCRVYRCFRKHIKRKCLKIFLIFKDNFLSTLAIFRNFFSCECLHTFCLEFFKGTLNIMSVHALRHVIYSNTKKLSIRGKGGEGKSRVRDFSKIAENGNK